MGLRMAYWFGFAAVAGAFGGLVGMSLENLRLLSNLRQITAFGVQHIHAGLAICYSDYSSWLRSNSLAVSDWRLLFIIEGIPAVILGIFSMFLLPDRPESSRSTRFLTEDERELQIARMDRYTSKATPGTVNKSKFSILHLVPLTNNLSQNMSLRR